MMSRKSPRWTFTLAVVALLWFFLSGTPAYCQWKRFAVDQSLRGADGVRLADANGDGLPDIATGWEESGTTRIYLHPGLQQVRDAWPFATVGNSPSVEDAVWVDFDHDGQLDVLSACEGKEQSLRVHIADGPDLLHADWETVTLSASRELSRWMFSLPVPSQNEPEYVVVGSKSPNGMVGILAMPSSSDLQSASIEKLCSATWIMSLESHDVDGDGDMDIIYSDRKGKQSGVYWLENPKGHFQTGIAQSLQKRSELRQWKKHLIGGYAEEVMFLSTLANDQGLARNMEIVVAVKPAKVLSLRPSNNVHDPWIAAEIDLTQYYQPDPASEHDETLSIGRAKAATIADFIPGGSPEIAYSCESADNGKSGVVLLSQNTSGSWYASDVSGPDGIKFDLIQAVDLDQDGDLDILTCEERYQGRGLGIIWYQNPSH